MAYDRTFESPDLRLERGKDTITITVSANYDENYDLDATLTLTFEQARKLASAINGFLEERDASDVHSEALPADR
jgi:hypothetical protein